MDVEEHPVTKVFDLVDGESALIIGLDITQYEDTCNSQ